MILVVSHMRMALRKLTAREHVLAASVLVVVLTVLSADITSPDAARLRSTGHATAALVLSLLPAFVLVAALLTLLPRTGNVSTHLLFRFAGRLPLLVRYLLVGFLFCALAETIKRFGG